MDNSNTATTTLADHIEANRERMEFYRSLIQKPSTPPANRVADIEAAIAEGDLIQAADPNWAVKLSRLSGMDQADLQRKHTYQIILTCLSRQTMTANEIAGLVGMEVTTIRPRMTELKQACVIEPTGERRHTGHGRCTAAVMRRRAR